MPSAKKKLCVCDVYKCCEEKSIDDDTHTELVGNFITPYDFKKHLKAQQEWLNHKAKEDDAIEDLNRRIIATSLETRELTDGSVTKQRKNSKGDAGLPRPRRASFVVGRDDSGETQLNESIAPPHQPLTHNNQIQLYHDKFLKLRNQFSVANTNFTFQSPPTSANQPTPNLPYTSRNGSSNKTFLDHQEKIRLLIDELDCIDVSGNEEVRASRRELIRLVQGHLSIVDGLPEKHWEMKKVECGLINRSNGSTIILDCCMYK